MTPSTLTAYQFAHLMLMQAAHGVEMFVSPSGCQVVNTYTGKQTAALSYASRGSAAAAVLSAEVQPPQTGGEACLRIRSTSRS
jgi:hypothetical protein